MANPRRNPSRRAHISLPRSRAVPAEAPDPAAEQVATNVAGMMVDMRALKAAALRLKNGHPARAVILAEPDFLRVEEYSARAVVWFRLLRASGDN